MTQLPLPPHSPTCMGCGPDNPAGLQLEVFRSGDEVYTDVTFDERHIGAPGLAHGGAVAAACDDLFGFTLWIALTPAVTRSLTVDYLAPSRCTGLFASPPWRGPARAGPLTRLKEDAWQCVTPVPVRTAGSSTERADECAALPP